MAQILVRDLDKTAVLRLKERARQNRRSLQREVKAILEGAIRRPSQQELDAVWRKWRKHWGDRKFEDSAMLIRQDRDSR